MGKNALGFSASPILRSDIYQSNPLIEARKTFDLIGMKIFILGLQGINPHFSTKDKFFDQEFTNLFIPATRLAELFGNTKYLHGMREACERLSNATIELNRPDGRVKLTHLFDELEYKPKEGLNLKFDPRMRPYLLDLVNAKNYTRIDVGQIFKLSSTYAMRLLELMLQYQNVREFKLRQEITREIKMDALRFMLNVPENAYKGRIDNFRQKVLDGPIKEINERTIYEMSYSTVKKGRKVIGFEFYLNTEHAPMTEINSVKLLVNNEALGALMSLGFTEKVARAIFGKCIDTADCFSRINRAQALLHRSYRPIRNKLGFLRNAIEKNWKVSRPRKQNDDDDKKFSFSLPFEPFGMPFDKTFKKTTKKTTKKTAGKIAEKPAENSSENSSAPVSLAALFAPTAAKLAKQKKASESPPQTSQEQASTDDNGAKELPFAKNKYNIPAALIQQLANQITAGEKMDLVEFLLKQHGLTISKFIKEFMTKQLTIEQEAT